jgi:hypothetical protein
LPTESVSLAYPGFRPDKKIIAEIEIKMEQLAPGPPDTVVLDLLSNNAYVGTDEDGLPLTAISAGDSSYHVIVSLTTAPLPTTIKKTLCFCTPLGRKLGNDRISWFAPGHDMLKKSVVTIRHTLTISTIRNTVKTSWSIRISWGGGWGPIWVSTTISWILWQWSVQKNLP